MPRRPELRAAPAKLPEAIERSVAEDPLFMVMTVDGMQWIEPYTAQLVPAGIGRVAAAREWLLAHPDRWKDRDPLGRDDLELVRVQHDLARRVETGSPFYDQRYCLFASSEMGLGWFNPCTAQFDSQVQRQDGRITPRTLNAMARALMANPDYRAGRLHDLTALRTKASALIVQARQAQGRPANPLSQTGMHQAIPAAVPAAAGGDEDMIKARQVQDHLLPDVPQVDGFDIGVHFTPHQGVSGDFYEIMRLADGRVRLAVGDVSGHGMQAALVVASALKTLRLLARQHDDLQRLIAAFNDEIKPDLPPGEFLTLVVVELDPETRQCRVLRAGHHPPIIANIGQQVVLRRTGGSGMAIGLATGESFARSLRLDEFQIEPGDVLALYTDGVTESEHPELGQFGEHRVCAAMLENLDGSSQVIADAIAGAALAHADGQSADDVTVLILAALEDGEEPV